MVVVVGVGVGRCRVVWGGELGGVSWGEVRVGVGESGVVWGVGRSGMWGRYVRYGVV